MEKKTGFFEETPGVKSSQRLMSFIFLLGLLTFDVLWALSVDFQAGMLLEFGTFNLMILVGVFTPKYLHKLAEKKQ